MALVNYIDEYLTSNNKVTDQESPHKRIGGVIIISTLLSVVTIASLGLYISDLSISNHSLYLALASAVPMVILWTAYFYLFLIYPAHQVVPLFGLSSIWLLVIELLFGAHVTFTALLGIGVLVLGAYILDSDTFRWKVPTKLLLIMLPVSLMWSVSLFLVRLASAETSVLTVFFYQYVGIGVIGLFLVSLIKPYRDGFLYRVKNQGGNFLGFSLLNETISQISFLFVMLAISLAPLGAYVTALGGVQSIFLLIIFFLFPIHERNQISPTQWMAIILITFGVFIIEFWK
ncbi:hypothetical protein KC845_01420 [Candidatus Kaiserbacteria bacterium]|nr:hypothetical protein [Candidatus Kaiserbacteria bacterium]